MKYEYSSYLRACFVAPFLESMFITFILIITIIYNVKNIIEHKDAGKSLVAIMMITCIWILLAVRDIGFLSHGGIHLIHEQEADAVEIKGTIESIVILDGRVFPETNLYEKSESSGAQFIIDGVPCIAFTKGNFKVGDEVCVFYLPKSGYILSMNQAS